MVHGAVAGYSFEHAGGERARRRDGAACAAAPFWLLSTPAEFGPTDGGSGRGGGAVDGGFSLAGAVLVVRSLDRAFEFTFEFGFEFELELEFEFEFEFEFAFEFKCARVGGVDGRGCVVDGATHVVRSIGRAAGDAWRVGFFTHALCAVLRFG